MEDTFGDNKNTSFVKICENDFEIITNKKIMFKGKKQKSLKVMKRDLDETLSLVRDNNGKILDIKKLELEVP